MDGAVDSKPLQVEIGSGRTYTISFRRLSALSSTLASEGIVTTRCLIVTDENVHRLYGRAIVDALEASGTACHVITLPPGETTKSLSYLRSIYDSALSWGIERETPLIAVGGGVVGDLAGFAAATLLRGVPLIHVPTTLVAQVDSAIGGKTGINHPTGKNLIGSFYQPASVVMDTTTLESLPERQWTSGLAEVVKHGLIADAGLVEFMEAHWAQIEGRHKETIDRMVPRAARIKAAIVSQDEREAGVRALLNFGHTFAHAIEKVSGYGTFTHGEAVAAGMRAAIHLSESVGEDLDAPRADELVARIPVPKGLADLEVSDLIDAMQSDKKVREGRVRFVLLRSIGEAFVTDEVSSNQVESAWRHAQDAVG